SAGREITATTTLEELGLSSLDRVELMMALEEAFQTTLDETALSGEKTIGQIENTVRDPSGVRSSGLDVVRPAPSESRGAESDVLPTRAGSDVQGPASEVRRPVSGPIDFPSWNRWKIAWFI